MTNEEKAKDILNCKHCTLGEKICFTPNETPCVDYRGIIKMAQWKDEQMKEALNNILIECDACFDEQTTNTLESIIKHQIEIL